MFWKENLVTYLFREAPNTIENWQPEITNSFIINSEANSKYINDYIEATNNYFESLKRMSYSIRNFNTF
ncbi:transposase [Mycoplasmatota bacterium]|nr:transposase [Mycoplasmatota bacterium]